MNRKRQLITSEQTTPCDIQITKPCTDCPWARTALAGWLGPMTKEEWIETAHGEAEIGCHVHIGPQCAGAAIYRANVGKLPRDRHLLRLPRDKVRVFATPQEFLAHHVIQVKSVRGKR